MELWLDTIDTKAIDHAKELGLLYGVTTNPDILSKTPVPVEVVLDDLLKRTSGPIAVQVTARTVQGMVDQGKDLGEYSQRIIVKVPVTEEGIQAIARLTHFEVRTMGTVVFQPLQALWAAKAGAEYVAMYYGHIDQPLQVAREIQEVLPESCKLLAAAVRTSEDVTACAKADISALTLNAELFQQTLSVPQKVFDQIDRFEEAWKKAPSSQLV